MNDVSVTLEHVHLLNGLDRLNVQFLKSCLELLVVGAGAFVDLLDLPAGCSLTAIPPLSLATLFSSDSACPTHHLQRTKRRNCQRLPSRRSIVDGEEGGYEVLTLDTDVLAVRHHPRTNIYC